MRFPPSFLDEIRARLPVSEVVRRRVKLAKAGRELVGLSPFGQERTPSFFVNDSKMAWFDFSSGKNGNIFDFIMETEGLSFPETVEMLAAQAGLTLPERSPDSERRDKQRAGLHEVLEWAAAFFERELVGSRGGKARTYLDGRGISSASRAAFRIGYAPAERFALRDALAAKGAGVETMCEAGLLIHGPDIAVPYDRFRDRVMFPIADRSGKVIAFGGRALEKDVQAKYLNSPETPLFTKGSGLFNHHRARKAAHAKGRVVAVEGYIDVVAMEAAGFSETVAGLGTALGEDQLALLWQMAPRPILCFDGDKAGRKAAYRAAETALPMVTPERTLAFALLPDGRDPDEALRGGGTAAMDAALDGALPLADLIWMRETEGAVLTTPEQRASLEHSLAKCAATIRDEALRRYYKADFDGRLQALFGLAGPTANAQPNGAPRGAFSGRRGSRSVNRPTERRGYVSAPVLPSASLTRSLARRAQVDVPQPREAMILRLVLAHPGLVDRYAEQVAAADFATPDFAALRDHVVDLVHEAPLNAAELRAQLSARGCEPLVSRIDATPGGAAWYLRPEASIDDADAVLRQALTLHHKARALHKELISTETALATDASEANIARMRDLQEQLAALTGMEAAIDGFGQSSGRTMSVL